jgi:hypothetical protein
MSLLVLEYSPETGIFMKNKNLLSHSSEEMKYKIKLLVSSVSSEDPVSASMMVPWMLCPHMVDRSEGQKGLKSFPCALIWVLILTLWPINIVYLGIELQHECWWWHKHPNVLFVGGFPVRWPASSVLMKNRKAVMWPSDKVSIIDKLCSNISYALLVMNNSRLMNQ